MKSSLLPVVIIQAESQRDRVKKLVDYCRDLDGTRIAVWQAEGNLPYPHCNNAALHRAAMIYKGEAFIWMEADAIPLKPNWRRELSDEYRRGKKEFMLSSDTAPPRDLVGGIGVYGPNTHWLIPERITQGGWDGWMIKHLKPLIHFTPLIQHSYGRYEGSIALPWRFPRDQKIIRPDAFIFHRDRHQELILKPKLNRFLHTGDLGDIVAALPSIRQLGGGELVITDKEHPKGASPRGKMKSRFNLIKSLLDLQPYILSVEWQDEPTGITHDLSLFRTKRLYSSLAHWQAEYLGIPDLNTSPWLFVDSNSHERIIVSRSTRYHNSRFPWETVIQKLGNKLLFVGLPEEHLAFETEWRTKIDYTPTDNLLDVASLIAGAPLGFYNQSCPFWIAIGLGKKLVQESYEQEPNSVIPRPNAYYSYDEGGIARIEAGLALL